MDVILGAPIVWEIGFFGYSGAILAPSRPVFGASRPSPFGGQEKAKDEKADVHDRPHGYVVREGGVHGCAPAPASGTGFGSIFVRTPSINSRLSMSPLVRASISAP